MKTESTISLDPFTARGESNNIKLVLVYVSTKSMDRYSTYGEVITWENEESREFTWPEDFNADRYNLPDWIYLNIKYLIIKPLIKWSIAPKQVNEKERLQRLLLRLETRFLPEQF